MNSAPSSQAAREACGRWFLANRSVEAAPNDPAALVGRAASFLAMDRPWEATRDLDRALRMQTRLAGADVAAAGEVARTRLLRGHAHAACLRYDRAVADFAEAEAILSRLGGSTDRSQPTPAHAQAGLGVAYCNMRDWQRCVDAGERAVRGLPLDDVARRHVARAVETARQHLSLAAGGDVPRRSGGSAAAGGSAAPPQPPPPPPRGDAGHDGGAAPSAPPPAPAPSPAPAPAPAPGPALASAPASGPSSATRRGRMSPGGDSPGRLPVEDVAEAALWAAGADSDGDLDAPRPGSAATGAARPDGAAPNDEAGAARPAATSPRPLLDSPSTSVSATLSNSSSIASEKNDEPKAPSVAAELVSQLAPGPA